MSLHSIVIDTNVIISALRSRQGASFRLIQLIGQERFTLNISVPLILEYEDVIHRLLPSLVLDEANVTEFLDYICSVGETHEIYYLWRPTLKDPKDEMVLELAVKAQARHIITFNKRDFAGSDSFGVTPITPAEFLRLIGK